MKFRKISPFCGQILESFPFIAEDFDQMTEYALYCKLKEKVDQIRIGVNDLGDDVAEYIAKFDALKNYVDNYFDNLDVQDEINNKLNEMAEDGTLENIINQEIFGEINTNLENLNTDINAIQGEINAIQTERKGIWGITRTTFDNIHHIIYSDDGLNFNYVGSPVSLNQDSSAVCEINGVFYYTGNGVYSYSTDLVHWSNNTTVLTNPTYTRVWGTSLFYDKLMNKIYAYSAFQYSNETISVPSGGTSYKFKIVYQEATQNDDGTLTFTSAQDLYFDSSKSYIDPYVVYDSVHGYLIMFKDEGESTCSLYSMTNPTSINTLKTTLKGVGIEAPQLMTDGVGNVFCYVQNFNLYPPAISGNLASLPNTQARVKLTTKEGFVASAVSLQDIVSSPEPFRHMGVAFCSDKAYTIIKQLGISCIPLMQQRYINLDGKKELREINEDGSYIVVNHPNIVYQVGPTSVGTTATVTLTLKSLFKNEPFKFLFNNCVVTWAGDIPSWWTYNKTFVNTTTPYNYIELPLLTGGVTRPIFINS